MNKKKIFQEILSFLWIIVVVFIIRILLIDISFVPTGSMQFSILPGDYILSTRYSYGYSNASIFGLPFFNSRILPSAPDRGDIVIVKLKNIDYKIVKRVIAFPGEKIEIKNNITYIDDVQVPRTFIGSFIDKTGIRYNQYREKLFNSVEFYSYNMESHFSDLFNTNSNFGPFYVPEGHYFFLGDNRDNSADSRSFLGFVPFESFISKAQYVIVSSSELLKRDSDNLLDAFKRVPIWLSSFRENRFLKNLYHTEGIDNKKSRLNAKN